MLCQLRKISIHQAGLNIAKAFQEAEEKGPTLLFIDEVEGLAPSRQDLSIGSSCKSEEVNEFLTQLNNAANRGILVVAATNRPNSLDQAVVRSGRMDKIIYVGPPDQAAREDLIRFHLRGRYHYKNGISFKELAKRTEGYSCSDIKLLIDEAARKAVKTDEPISQAHFDSAIASIPPSVPKKVEAEYSNFISRGTGKVGNVISDGTIKAMGFNTLQLGRN